MHGTDMIGAYIGNEIQQVYTQAIFSCFHSGSPDRVA